MTYLPINFFAVWVIESNGIRSSIMIGCFTQLIGFWLRFTNPLNQHKYVHIIVGQILITVGASFI